MSKTASPHPQPAALALTLPPDALRPLVEQIVTEVLARLDQARATLPADRLAYSEPEAARLLGMQRHQLRDERLRGRIQASKIVGKQVRYLPQDLTNYLMRQLTDVKEES
jgi:hypothetical protein